MSVLSLTELDAFCAPLLQSGPGKTLAAAIELSEDKARRHIASVCNEAHAGLRLLAWAGLRGDHRALEVGAGSGLLTAYLQSHSVDLVAIEPVGTGFDATPAVARVVR
jgi:protein-L-isoaspartate O-methyltransferase